MPASIWVAFGLAVFALSRARLRCFNRGCIDDVNATFRQNDVLGFKLTVDLSQ